MSPPAPSGAAATAVRTDHLALLCLVENACHVVIELEDDRIGLTAIDAWVGREELDQVAHPLQHPGPLYDGRLLDIALPKRRVRPFPLRPVAEPHHSLVVVLPEAAHQPQLLAQLAVAAAE